ncbi:unnamed protein product [Aspergillus oryzae RIB40]|uniref:DNA, SC005 n=1 Tax=Aspergillus oryzae (strain ATCC 42149 / RIB 40) TaxID=510516 RepID=Q2UQX5_ASPOR|nr:unnamed protein product [Aspergillus oryzae RIB40]BAE56040.1 unnamed protein product [Aspergillus oryzae RIB40]
MTSLNPRDPYTQEELEKLYPRDLKLQLVQVVNARRCLLGFKILTDYFTREDWPYCNVARRMIQMAASNQDLSQWKGFEWRKKTEAFGDRDEAVVAVGATGDIEGICQHGELTDRGRETTFALGQRLRHLYVDQLGFMPKIKSDTEDMYLRATPIPRALESLQQAFWGMYPASARTQDFPPPVIVARSVSEETLFPNEGNCRRFRQLARLFADRAALRWNETEQMNYINSILSKWMPEKSPKVAVDSHPRLSGINDTINATDAHGPATRLPSEFYDKKLRQYMEQIAVDEWFAGYNESTEYRKLGIGALLGDVVDRMGSSNSNTSTPPPPSETARAPLASFPDPARQSLQKHYVRIRYNDVPVRIPGCAAKPQNHLAGDDTFCTLDAFKEIVDKFTPKNWREECTENIGAGLYGKDDKEKAVSGF